jgi:uncharacterized protein
MSITENKELVLGFFDDIGKGRIQEALDRMAEDLRFTLIGTTGFSGVCKSRKEFVDRILAPLGARLEGPLTITTENLITEGDFVVAQSRGRSTTRKGGCPTTSIATCSESRAERLARLPSTWILN